MLFLITHPYRFIILLEGVMIGERIMERVYAFTDEYGALGWDLDNPSVSTCFIITAIIVKASDVEQLEQQSETIRKKVFPNR